MHFIVSKHELRAAERLHHDTSELERRILDLDTFISHTSYQTSLQVLQTRGGGVSVDQALGHLPHKITRLGLTL